MSEPLEIDFNTLKTNIKSQAYSINNSSFVIKDAINFDVLVLKIRPDTLFFIKHKGSTKLLPIKANINISYAKGFSMVAKPLISPAYVSVSGDSTTLNQLDTIYTLPIHLKDIHENYSSTITLKKISENVNYNVKDVALNFKVDRFTEASVKIPVQISNKTSNEKIKLLPDFVTVTYLVSMTDYNNITANSFRAVVNYNHIIEKQKALKVELNVAPSEVNVLKIEPSTISYLIYK